MIVSAIAAVLVVSGVIILLALSADNAALDSGATSTEAPSQAADY